eukprot:s1150_g13.t1
MQRQQRLDDIEAALLQKGRTACASSSSGIGTLKTKSQALVFARPALNFAGVARVQARCIFREAAEAGYSCCPFAETSHSFCKQRRWDWLPKKHRSSFGFCKTGD